MALKTLSAFFHSLSNSSNMNFDLHLKLKEELLALGFSEWKALLFKDLIIVLGVAILATIANFLGKWIITNILQQLFKRTKTNWDDILIERRVFHRLSHLAPAFILYSLAPFALSDFPPLVVYMQMAARIYLVIVIVRTLDSFLNALHEIYLSLEISKVKPIKGYIQIVKIILYLIASIITLSILLNVTPTYLLGGLGAATAVIMLIFKDPIMGFVGSVQLSAHDMVRPEDWISMPKYNADGIVVEMNLTTIKVQNWDNTITTIPTYALISESFQNWRGMQESGGRRIKRSINIDMNSICLCDDAMIQKFMQYDLIRDYINKKEEEINKYNKSHNIDTCSLVNGRRQTNIGIFRAYLEEYLRKHPYINNDLHLFVRQLQPGENGLPIEVYAFCTKKEIEAYEHVQSNIFDHILAVIPQFGLRIFQNPSGADFRNLLTSNN